MIENNETKEISDRLLFKVKNVFDYTDKEKQSVADRYADEYIHFMNRAKTEREAVVYGIEEAEKNGFKNYDFGDKIERGGKYYYNNRGKSLFLFSVGTENLEKDGIRISAAHIDSPRVDLKQHPLFEDGGMS